MNAPCYQVMPPLSQEDYAALKADILARGVQVPIEYDEAGRGCHPQQHPWRGDR